MSFFSHVSSNKINQLSTQLAQRAKQVGVNVDDFTGANDTAKFYNANVYALANNEKITLTRDLVLDANIQNNFEVASIDGNGKTITVNNKVRLYIGDKCKFIKNVNFIDTKFYAKTDFVAPNQGEWDYGYIFEQKADTFVNSFEVNNVTLKGTVDTATGTNRIRGLMEVCGNNITINKCVINDCRSGFRIQKNTYLTKNTRGLVVKDVSFYNVEQGILFFSMKDVKLENLTLTNTVEQASNYTTGLGADLINFMYSDDIHIKNINTSYPVERTIYAITSNNVIVDGFIINNTGNGSGGGIKFSAGYGDWCKNTKIMNGVFTGIGKTDCFDLYNVDGVTIDNVDVKATSGAYAIFINAIMKNKNITVKNCNIYNLKTNLFYSAMNATVGGTPVAHVFENITFDNCYIVNPVDIADANGRCLFDFYNSDGINTLDQSKFLIKNITFSNNTVIQTLDGSNLNVNYIETGSKFLSLFSASIPVNELKFINNIIKGCKDGVLAGFNSNSNGSVEGRIDMAETATAPIPTGIINFQANADVHVSNVNGHYKNKLSVRGVKLTSNVEYDYTPTANEVKYIYRSTATNPTYTGFGEIMYEDGLYEKFKVVNNAGVLSLVHIAGDGTLSGGAITFTNGSQVELGPTYKELRHRSGATPKQFFMKVICKR